MDDHVRPQTEVEKELYLRLSDIVKKPPAYLSSRYREPALTIHNIEVSGPNNPTVIPGSVKTQLSLCIVPDHDVIAMHTDPHGPALGPEKENTRRASSRPTQLLSSSSTNLALPNRIPSDPTLRRTGLNSILDFFSVSMAESNPILTSIPDNEDYEEEPTHIIETTQLDNDGSPITTRIRTSGIARNVFGEGYVGMVRVSGQPRPRGAAPFSSRAPTGTRYTIPPIFTSFTSHHFHTMSRVPAQLSKEKSPDRWCHSSR
ncbi:hypothetical protein D9757_001619 [Collybiopsis confluens]|uniref:Uncharacterized protein n=1 Tax=Collybiopsis confluens TaxID=2823264 RepID=A0A8H5MFF9_9AGAR|nr:hypothetical protein D9757_001619 [Collybiopsis confluens]